MYIEKGQKELQHGIPYSLAELLADAAFSYPPFLLGFSEVMEVFLTAALLSSNANGPLNIHIDELIYLALYNQENFI